MIGALLVWAVLAVLLLALLWTAYTAGYTSGHRDNARAVAPIVRVLTESEAHRRSFKLTPSAANAQWLAVSIIEHSDTELCRDAIAAYQENLSWTA